MNRNVLLSAVFAVLLAVVGLLLYLNFAASPPAQGEPDQGPPVAARPGQPRTPAPGRTGAGPVAGGPPARVAAGGAAGTPAAAGEDGATPTPYLRKKVMLTLYFEGTETELLYPEEREAVEAEEPAARARVVLEELAKGPAEGLLPTLPKGTSVHEVYLDNAGVAYVDFSHQIRDAHIGGSEGEIMTIDSVVNSVARNVPEVQAVQILVEGRPIATLAGHIDLTRPLFPSSEFIARER